MQWMVIWMHPYFIKAMEVDCADWIWLTSGYTHTTTTMTWLRPRNTSDWIKLPSYISIMCLSTLRCSGWSYEWILTSSMPWAWAELAESCLQLGTKHTTTPMTWLSAGPTSDWITLPSYTSMKCLSTLWCSEWSYGWILTSSKPWAWAELAESGSQLGTKHTTTTMTWLRPGTTSDWITHPSYTFIKCFSTFRCSEWSYVWILTSSKPWAWAELA